MSMDGHLSPLIAHHDIESMTGAEIRYVGSIVWSVEEFCAATEASTLGEASAWNSPARGRRASDHAVDHDELFAMLLDWFADRYRSHARPVAAAHLLRYMRISRFLLEHRDALEARGWVQEWNHLEDLMDPDLLRALVTIRCPTDAGRVAADGKSASVDLKDILLLRSAFHEGALEVREFERMPWEPEGASGRRRTGSPPIDACILSPGQLLAALLVLEDHGDVDTDEWSSLERRLRREVPEKIRGPLEATGPRLLLLSWLLWEVELDLESANVAANRVLAAHRFLKTFGPRLVEDGLAIRGKLRIRWKPVLIETLAYADLQRAASSPEIPDPEYVGIVGAAWALSSYQESIRLETAASGGGQAQH